MQRLLLSSACALALAASCTGWLFAQQASPVEGKPIPPRPNAALNGLWDYNEKLSLDAATGQPEQSPLSAGQRARSAPDRSTTPPVTTSAGPAAGAAATAGTSTWGAGGGAGTTTGTGTTAGAAGGAAGGSVSDFERSVRDQFLTERRDLVRDLLEVPEVLRVRVTNDGVTFVDDLQRLRIYPTSGHLQKYQLGAAQFQARAYWDGGEFHKDIEASGNFKLSEVYRVSADGNQLFVSIKIGDPKKNETLAGVNRVYDRVVGRQPVTPPTATPTESTNPSVAIRVVR